FTSEFSSGRLRTRRSPGSSGASFGSRCCLCCSSRAAQEHFGDRIGTPPLRTGMPDEALRRPLAPLRLEAFLGGQKVAAIGGVQPVGIGPALMHAAPRVGPVIVDLAAKQVAADPPHVLVLANLLQVL